LFGEILGEKVQWTAQVVN